MLSVLIITTFIAIACSFSCSLTEAAFYAVTMAQARTLAEGGSRVGKVLVKLKNDVSKPVAAILILNTVANTIGAAIVGAQAAQLWGEVGLVLYSIGFALVILLVGEIVPKVLGVTFAKKVILVATIPLNVAVRIFYPLVWTTSLISKQFSKKENTPSISEDEMLTMAAIGTEEGTLHRFEGSVIENVIYLDQTLVKEIITPRTSVFKMPADMTVGTVRDQIGAWKFSRVPIYNREDPDHLSAYVTQRDIYRSLLLNQDNRTLASISRPLSVVPEVVTLDKVLQHMFDRQEHILTIIDEHGALAGIITLEDILEELVGHEIEDEYH